MCQLSRANKHQFNGNKHNGRIFKYDKQAALKIALYSKVLQKMKVTYQNSIIILQPEFKVIDTQLATQRSREKMYEHLGAPIQLMTLKKLMNIMNLA